MTQFVRVASLPLLLLCFASSMHAQAVRANQGFRANQLERNDDGSTSAAQALGFTINFFGLERAQAYVNNNGNITFDQPLAQYTPEGIVGFRIPMIAPFFADVDTRGTGSSVVTFGTDTVDGRRAFGVNYVTVGYFSSHADKLNSFQLVLIDRSDTGAGNFDIEFNYDRISWETGDASGGVNGFGGVPAAAGYSNGSGTSFEVPGSLVPGSFLDSSPNGLIRRTLNSSIPGRMVFNARAGAVCQFSIVPSSQSFPVSGGPGSISVNAASGCAWTATTAANWITITSGGSGTSNGAVAYSVAANAGPPRAATILVGGLTHIVAQAGTGVSGGTLRATPGALNLSAIERATPTLHPIQVLGRSGRLAVTTTVLNGPSSWLGFASVSEPTALDQLATVTIGINYTALTPGFYQGLVTISDPAGSVSIPVTLVVTSAAPRLGLNQNAFVFTAAQGGGQPASQTLRVFNLGAGSLSWSLPQNPGAPWLTISPPSGSAGTSSTITVNTSGLSSGVHQVSVPVTATGATNSPQLVTITLNVAPPNAPTAPVATPHGLLFLQTAGGAAPSPQTLSINNTGSGSALFTLSASTVSGGNWLSVSPASGTVSTSATTAQVSVSPGLAAGVYRGKITAAFSPGGTQEVDVIYVSAPATASAEACTPRNLDLVATSIGSGATLAVSFPRVLLTLVVDDCGTGLTNATVAANIGTANIPLQSLGAGLYSGTFVPQAAASNVSVALSAAHSSFASVRRTYTVSIVGAAGGVELPFISDDGVVDGAAFTPRRPLVPGGIVSLFGSFGNVGTQAAAFVPLPRELSNLSVRIGGQTAPLYFVSPRQVNAQVPFEVSTSSSLPILVNSGGRLTTPQSYVIAPAQPAIFGVSPSPAILDSGFRQISPQNPARIGDTIQIFATGMGVTDVAVETGASWPGLSTVRSPATVTIGGLTANVVFQGLAPGFVGLYQVNAVVPAVTPGGAVPIIIQQNGVPSNPESIITIPVR